jgi:hypothetical protein
VSSSAGRVVVVCESCDLELAIGISPMTKLRSVLGSFFTEHDGCETTIDVSSAHGLRLVPASGSVDHPHG